MMEYPLFATQWFNAAGPQSRTMAAYEMNGTPTLLVFDRDGNLRLNHSGHIDDLALGALLGRLTAAP